MNISRDKLREIVETVCDLCHCPMYIWTVKRCIEKNVIIVY